jgi:anti-sigma B factor antagonist
LHQHSAVQIDAGLSSKSYVIRLRGELDLSGCRELELALVEAERSAAARILVDLEELTFVDASGLNVLLTAGRRSALDGSRLRITPGNGQVARIFRLTALESTLPFTNGHV